MLNSMVSYSPYPIIYFIGILSTRLLHFQTKWSLVLCVATVGFIGSILSQFLFPSIKKHADSMVFSGSLAAMAGTYYAHTLVFFALTSLIATILYFNSSRVFSFLGGRLGTIAFLSTGISFLIFDLLFDLLFGLFYA